MSDLANSSSKVIALAGQVSRKRGLEGTGVYTTAILSDATAVLALGVLAPHLISRESAVTPKHFLASLDERIWAPRVIVLRAEEIIIGIVFAKEKLIAGLPTGIIFADSTLDFMVVALPVHRELVFGKCVQALLDSPRIRGLRLLVPKDGYESASLERIPPSIIVSRTSVKHHFSLPLPQSYELFLQSLGYRTRRNFRHYRRLSPPQRSFVETVPFSDFKAAAYRLIEQSGIAADLESVDRAMKVLEAAAQPVLVGLKDPNRDYVSILGGWREENRIVVFFQMNSDLKYPDASLSIVLRSHFIELAITQGISNLIFWSGCGGALTRYVKQIPTAAVYLDKPSIFWRATRRAIEQGRRVLPLRFRRFASWVVLPSRNSR